MRKHSPIPWTRGTDGLVFDAKQDLVVDTYGSSLPDEGDGNQELIVRAVNCHEELVEACEAAVIEILAIIEAWEDSCGHPLPSSRKYVEPVLAKAGAIVAKAKGETP